MIGMMRLGLGLFANSSRFLVDLLPDGSYSTRLLGNGDVEVTVTTPESMAGTYTFDPDDMATGPVFLTNPTATGTQAEGQTLTAASALIAYRAEDGVPTSTWSWLLASVEDGTDSTYVLPAGFDTDGVDLEQTATNSAGARSATGEIVSPPAAKATGGTITYVEDGGTTYAVHTFTSSGTFAPTESVAVNYEAVGGGAGSGGSGYTSTGGGGGGMIATGSGTISTDATVTVGAGGTAGAPFDQPGGTGGTTSLSGSLTASALGGGGSNRGQNQTANAAGNAGGGSSAPEGYKCVGGTSTGSGYDGGDAVYTNSSNSAGGGGAGAGANGSNAASDSVAGAGGAGVVSTVPGSSATYGGGGGGGTDSDAGTVGAGGAGGGGTGGAKTIGTAGTANTGGGAGGSGNAAVGAAGGSGIVIIWYDAS